jgi:RNA polymerase sigma-70 factor (ECF subfamily)
MLVKTGQHDESGLNQSAGCWRINSVEATVIGGRRMTVGDQTSADAATFTAWVEPHLPAMTRLAARLVAPGDRDDVVQEALLRAWRRHGTFDPDRGSATGWLLAIVADQGRRRRTRGAARTVELVDADRAVLDASPDLDLERAIAALTARQRLAVDLHYFVGLDIAGCAEVMGCAPGTVKATLHQARHRLREALAGTGGAW